MLRAMHPSIGNSLLHQSVHFISQSIFLSQVHVAGIQSQTHLAVLSFPFFPLVACWAVNSLFSFHTGNKK